MEGLWVSLRFRDGEVLEGVIPNNLLQLETFGFTIIPPDPYSNNQRIYIPRAALQSVAVLGTGTDFGSRGVSRGSRDLTYTIYNVGATNLELTGNPKVNIGGAQAGDFLHHLGLDLLNFD